ncbi:10894_t:CDS:1, partial [Acaulospora colombiana]
SHYGTSSVEELELRDTCLREEGISELLKLPRALKKFIYSEESAQISRHINPHNFRRSLECVSTSLELLDVSLTRYKALPNALALWSFENFASLRALYINYRLVYGLDPDSAPCIAKSLPKSLEVLAMRRIHESNKWTNESVLKVWQRLLVQKSPSCLTRLRVIAHLTHYDLLLPLAELGNTRGVRFARKWEEMKL